MRRAVAETAVQAVKTMGRLERRKERTYAKLPPGERVRMLRELHGMTRSQLARAAGLPNAQAVTDLEKISGEYALSATAWKRMRRVAKALKVDSQALTYPESTKVLR